MVPKISKFVSRFGPVPIESVDWRRGSLLMAAGRSMKSLHILRIILPMLAWLLFTDTISAQTSSIRRPRLQPSQQPQPQPQPQQDNVVAEMQVFCQSDAIVLMVNTNNPFNGMLYAKDAPSSNNCVSEFHSSTNMTFKLPLKSCGTLSAEVDDGIEYFNTVVVQPHMRLMTNQGKGYHIRCKYQTRERTIANTHFNVSAAFLMQNGPQGSTTPLLATASMPMCTMKIYRVDQDNVAESVKVGDKLVMVIEIDKQDMYGMRITNCVVRDGLNKAEQQLISEQGCPIDETIMPKFDYESNNTRAAVAFKAHKFPHTSSVYYQCNVRLCINNGNCDQVNCQPDGLSTSGSSESPIISGPTQEGHLLGANVTDGPRQKRYVLTAHHHHNKQPKVQPLANSHQQAPAEYRDTLQEHLPKPSELKAPKGADNDMSFDVYSGLYVSDITDLAGSNTADPNGQQVLPARPNSETGSQRDELAQLAGGSNPDPCLTIGKASLLVILASLGSVFFVLLISCQAGLLGRGGGGGEFRGRRFLQQAGGSLSNASDLSSSPSLDNQTPRAHSRGRQPHCSSIPTCYSAPRTTSKNFLPPVTRYGLGLIY